MGVEVLSQALLVDPGGDAVSFLRYDVHGAWDPLYDLRLHLHSDFYRYCHYYYYYYYYYNYNHCKIAMVHVDKFSAVAVVVVAAVVAVDGDVEEDNGSFDSVPDSGHSDYTVVDCTAGY